MTLNNLQFRAEATEATRKKFYGRPFKWGSVDCVKMARFHAVKMKHRPPKMPPYTTEIGALRAIKKTGFDSVDDIFSSMFPPINLAKAQLGDFVLAEGQNGVDAVFIFLGRKMMGFHEEADELVVVIPDKVKSVYRV